MKDVTKEDIIDDIENAIYNAERERSKLAAKERLMSMKSLSSKNIKHLLSNLASEDYIDSFLDLGCFRGITLISTLLDNDITGYGVDHFKYNPYESPIYDQDGWDNVKAAVNDNVKIFELSDRVKIINADATDLNMADIDDPINLIYMDITVDSIKDTLLNLIVTNGLDKYVILINPNLRDGESAQEIDRVIAYEDNVRLLKTWTLQSRTLEDTNTWWNGVSIWLLKNTTTNAGMSKEDRIKEINKKTQERKNDDKKVSD
tara:strand:+ start:14192 stop:14971 length:780 start_codon:yes stop_codon:yes gene_type:complete